MQRDDFADKRWQEVKFDGILYEIEHYDNCQFKDKPYPMNECACDCYEQQIFEIGYEYKDKQMHK